MISDKQVKLLAKLYRRTGRTFQRLAREAGLKHVPDHMCEISEEDAAQIINTHRGWLQRG